MKKNGRIGWILFSIILLMLGGSIAYIILYKSAG
jgi:Fic family protein